MNNKISEFDKKVYEKIRKNIVRFINEQALIYDSERLTLLDIAPQDHAGAKQFFLKSRVLTADIDQNSGADFIVDICENNADKISSGLFDIVVCTEVLEHTLNPFLAIEEIFRILKQDGVLLMSTPFDFRIHGPLPDCWRFTEHGIRALLKEFDQIEINSLPNEDRFLMPLHYTTVARKVKK